MTTGRINQVASVNDPAHRAFVATPQGRNGKLGGVRHSRQPKCWRDTMGRASPRSPRVPHPREQPIHMSRKSHRNTRPLRITCITVDSHQQPHMGALGWKGPDEGHEFRFGGRQHRNRIMNAKNSTAHGGTLKRAACKPFDARARSRLALTTRSPLTRPHVR